MVQLIVGKKGKGKTKQLLDKVNSEVRSSRGTLYIWIKAPSTCLN